MLAPLSPPRPGGSSVSAIAVENISKHWTTAEGQVHAVDGLSFALDEGTLNVLLGPSGCGKSTTLRLIAGLEPADAGRILIDGRDVSGLPPARRNIAMVFQSYALFPHLPVSENIVFGLKVRRVAASDVARRLRRTAELLGLDGLLDRKPSQLSGGQQQRVALGRAIIAEAPVCLMDEPLSNLDAQLRQEMRAEIRNLQRQLGITMVYVTHGVRPEHVAVALDRGVPATVAAVEYLGADSLVTCRLGSATLATRVSGSVGLAPGDSVRLIWAAGAQHIFASDGTRREEPIRH